MDKVTGYVTGVNGNLVSASFSGSVRKNEVGYVLVGDDRLKGEVIRVNGDTASMQIYEMTDGIQVGDPVELSGELMSVELGPGLLTQVYDGLQNPLPELAEAVRLLPAAGRVPGPHPQQGLGVHPRVKPGDHVSAGDAVGSVPEGLFTHLIMVPFGLKGRRLEGQVRPGKGRLQCPRHRGGAGKRERRGKRADHGLFLARKAAHPLLRGASAPG
ncbi:MAG: hypothetical protein ACLUNQ_06870 [Oscillospiraceae bacterium]